MKRSKVHSCILYKKDDNGKLELVMTVYIDYVFVAGKTEKLKITKYVMNQRFNIQYSGKVKKFLKVYYELGRETKELYKNWWLEKDVRKLVEDYWKYNRGDVKVQKTPDALDTTLSQSDLEEPNNIDKYSSFMVQLMRFTTNVGPDVENEER